MKLRSKLIINLSLLLFGYVVIVFFVPTIIVVRDIERVGKEIHALIIKKHRRLVRDQEVLVEEIFQQMRASINASLLFVYESDPASKALVKLKDGDYYPVWKAAAHIASENPTLGFLQVSMPGEEKAVVLKPSEAKVYRATSRPLQERTSAIKVSRAEHELYLGVELPKEFQPKSEHKYYALVDYEKAKKEKTELEKEFKGIQGQLDELDAHLDVGQVFTAPDNARTAAMNWLYKMEMIQLLTPLVVEGMKLQGDQTWVPDGVARVSVDGTAEVIFSNELLSTKPIVPAAKFFEEHSPPIAAPPIGEGNFFVYDESLKHVYIANVVDLGGVYLSLGSSADKVARDFAVWSDKPVLISVGDQLWMGYDGMGQRYSMEDVNKFAKYDLVRKETGIFKVDGGSFFFANIAQFEGGRIGIYELSQLDGKNSIASLSLDVAHKLAWRISFQLFAISVLIILLILFALSRMVMYLTVKPVVRLAHITEQIVAGQYEDIKWPDMGKRNDEVAKLARSFEEMVKGLQEKEKIRGVLDKVVSKDVATEILKTQIHLGGEDRHVSVLFSDIRSFTTLTEHLSPHETIDLLNSCMTKITQVIEGEGGVIDKFVGDAVMAIYGAPTKVDDHALRAVSSGLLTLRALSKWNDDRQNRGLERVEMGIGINTGLVVAGNMGAVDRLNYTVLGMNVNVASRLCSIAKPTQLIISEQTLNEPRVKDSFYVEPLPSVMLKGFSEPFRIYHVIDFKWEQ
ncbi:MAG: hypothetical protein S4CHLAM81_15260 [Chlamydiales bacterium]|nr:hypothetical protein [Chlamydiales bacterium]MCH9636295.1 hypothetical protein [Chlamydiales bacterium]MCH9703191.1 adenylate/guanylate cyclase domain-containing protein [Chlamydiota bacterium]